MYKSLVVIAFVFIFSGCWVGALLSQEMKVEPGFVTILTCEINGEVQATISNLVIAGQVTDQYKLETKLSPVPEFFNARAGLNVHERFTRICSAALAGEVVHME